jgi:crotonobetainyl-CoA:carnitine CoA-transferase CaiB-like acyl-CoA transferase
VTTAGELLDIEQLWARGFYQEVTDRESGIKMVYPGAPYKLSESGWQLTTTAPQAGQHNRQVYCQELRLSDKEFEALIASGVI